MVEPLSDAELQRILAESQAAMEAVRAGELRPGEGQGQPAARGIGEAHEGKVKAMVSYGRLDSVELDPRVRRLPPEELAEHVRTAINNALGDLMGGSTTSIPDLGALAEQLRDVEDQTAITMERFSQGITQAMDMLRKWTYVSGEPNLRGMAELMSRTRRDLDEAIEVLGTQQTARGEGAAANGRVRVTVAALSVESVTIDPQAMRMASQDLAAAIVSATNGAVAEMRTAAQSRPPEPGKADTAQLNQHLQETQELTFKYTEQMLQSLTDIMSSIKGPDE